MSTTTHPIARSCFARKAFSATLALLAVTFVPARADYPTTVLGDGPKAYYRFKDNLGRTNVNRNSTSLGAAANATNLNVHPFSGALAGSGSHSQFFDSTARAIIPWNADLNPTNTAPFTVEAWFYPASDQINGGQAVINNRYSYSGVNRQGWVIFQRAQDLSYVGKPGYEGVGWNFRMYNANGSSSALEVVSQVAYPIGKWTHVAVVYDPVKVTDATLTIYIDGVAANTNVWSGAGPAYVANTDDHPAAEAVNGPSGIAFGSYNNTQPGSNPYFGAVDEFAFYSNKLSSAQILAHYQNGTSASRSTPYETLVQADKPVAYLRLDELATDSDIALNLGNLRAGGQAANTAAVQHSSVSALTGRTDDSAYGYHWENGGGTTTDMPWLAANNPAESVPFTVEGWFRPTNDRQNPGPSPVNNRYVKSGNRTGWVIYQRAPNATYTGVPGYSGVGWTFRMYHGSGTSGNDVLTGNDYQVGEWQHLVVTWEPVSDNGAGAWSDTWSGILTAYINGAAVATNTSALYTANTNPTEDNTPAADLAVGSYNAASGFGEEFEGNIDEFALYNNYVLTPDQILAHYQTGTNSHPATSYETLVLTAAYTGDGTQLLMPATYLRFNDPARHLAANSGTLGDAADGSLLLTSNDVAGPQSPAYSGFEPTNTALALDGLKGWASLNNPPGLNVAGQITLEAWIKPSATQVDPARIISHGPPTLSSFLSGPPPETNGSVIVGSELFLRVDGAGANYSVGSSDGTNTHGVSYAIPAGDLGGARWVHLVGTYDGTHWKLFRNGTQVAAAADSIGALPVNDGDWAIGATGNGWKDYFAGAIDEAAIYNQALSANQVQAHYSAGLNTAGPLKLAISRPNGGVSITWPAGTLQQANVITGPFGDVPSAKSPYSPPTDSSVKFYRLRL